jgi:uncharacterized protein (DUF302 family)
MRRHNGAASIPNPTGISGPTQFCAKLCALLHYERHVRGFIMSKPPYALCAALLMAVQLLLVVATGSPAERAPPLVSEDGIVRMRSVHAFADTVERLRTDIAAKGILLFAVLDQRRLGAEAGVNVRPSTLLLFGNPALGTQFLTANPEAGLDWPVRLLVYEDAMRQVWVSSTDFAWIARRYRIGDRAAAFAMAEDVIASITASVSG